MMQHEHAHERRLLSSEPGFDSSRSTRLCCLKVLQRQRVEQVDEQLLAVLAHAGVGTVGVQQADVQQLQGQVRQDTQMR